MEDSRSAKLDGTPIHALDRVLYTAAVVRWILLASSRLYSMPWVQILVPETNEMP